MTERERFEAAVKRCVALTVDGWVGPVPFARTDSGKPVPLRGAWELWQAARAVGGVAEEVVVLDGRVNARTCSVSNEGASSSAEFSLDRSGLLKPFHGQRVRVIVQKVQSANSGGN